MGPQPVGGSQAGTPIQGRIYTKKSSGVLRHALFHFTSVSAYQIIGLLPSEKQLSPRIFIYAVNRITNLIIRLKQSRGKLGNDNFPHLRGRPLANSTACNDHNDYIDHWAAFERPGWNDRNSLFFNHLIETSALLLE